MTVQNYIGVNVNDSVQTEIEFTSEVEVAIYDRVEEIIRDVFSGESSGTTPESSGVDASNYYTKKEIEELLKDIFDEQSSGEIPVMPTIDLSDYLTKADASNTYATNSDLAEAMEAVNETVQNDYLSKTDASNTYATDSEVAEAMEAVNENVQENYLSKTDAASTYATKTSLGDYYTKTQTEDLIKDIFSESSGEVPEIQPPDFSNYYTKSEVDTKIADVSTGGTVDLSNYLTQTDASNIYARKTSLQPYLTSLEISMMYATKASLNDYYNKSEVDSRIANASTGGSVDLSNYLTTSSASNTYATKTSLSDYLTKTDASNTYAAKSLLNNYYTKTDIDDKLSNNQANVDLSDYLTKTDASSTYIAQRDALKYLFQTYSRIDEMFESFYPKDESLKNFYVEVMSCASEKSMKDTIDILCASDYNHDELYPELMKIFNYYKQLFMNGYISSEQLLYRAAFMDKAIAYLREKTGVAFEYAEDKAVALVSSTIDDLSNYYRKTEIDRAMPDEECSEPMISNLDSWSAGGNLGLDGYWLDIAFGHGVFVAVGYTSGNNGVAAYSTTSGRTWKPSAGAILTTSAYWESITYGKGRFVALATTARQSGNENFIAYSDDFGKTWALAENVPKEQGLTFITYGGGRFIALGDRWGGTDGRYMAYSNDGIKWTANKLPEFYDVGASQGNHVNYWKTAAYGDGRWVAITNYNTSAYSEDGGITWTKGGDLPYETTYGSVAFGNHRFVAITAMPRKTSPLEYFSIYSDDGGITWKVGGNVYDSYTNIIYANGRFIAGRAMDTPIANFPHIIYSKDGITWTRKSVGTDNVDNWKGLGYGNGRVVLAVSKAANPSQNTMICSCAPLVHSHLS